jgi:CubicO group peptidase (beta-lactamase class C family)
MSLLAVLPSLGVAGCVAYRPAVWGAPSPDRQPHMFAAREVQRADEPFCFHRAEHRSDLDTITVRAHDGSWLSWEEYMERGRVRAFLVIRNDTILYETYRAGYDEATLSGSYSATKSITSALLGTALGAGSIGSLDDPVTAFLPEVAGDPDFAGVTLRHALEMRTGFSYRRATGRLSDVRSDDARFYYTGDLVGAVLGMRRASAPGGAWEYRDSDTQLLGLILTRAIGASLAEQIEDRIWRRIGTEFDASWSLDRRGGMEKAATGFNARARDYARFVRLYLNGGKWDGRQLIPAAWVIASTTPDTARTRPEVATWWRMQHRKLWWIPLQDWSRHRDFYADGAKGQRLYGHAATGTIIIQLADDDRHDFPFRRIARYLSGQPYSYPDAELPDISGYYEGTAASEAIGEVGITVNLLPAASDWTGTLHTPFGDFLLTAEKLAEGVIAMRFVAGDGEPGSISAQFSYGELVGTFELGGDSGRISLRRLGEPRDPGGGAPRIRLDIDAAAWQEDLLFMARELVRLHGDAYHTMDARVFADSVAAVNARIPALEAHEAVAAMARLVAMVGDGHTYLELPPDFRTYPLRLRWFSDTLRVTAAAQQHSDIVGGRIMAIDGTPLREADLRIRRHVAHAENEQYVRAVTPWSLTLAELLHAYGVANGVEQSTWTIATDAGSRDVVLRPTRRDQVAGFVSARPRPPLAFSQPGVELWYQLLPDDDALYVNFSGYPGRTAFAAFFDEVFELLESEQTQRLVIDLRENRGGDFNKARDLLLPRLEGHPLNHPNRLLVLIGRNTFSAGMTTAADFRNMTAATLVGEPTGARPNGWQEKGSFRLPNSGLAVSLSMRYYTFMDEDADAVNPHQHVEESFEQFRQARDVVLECALRSCTVQTSPSSSSLRQTR